MTTLAEDPIQYFSDDISTRLNKVAALKGKHLYVYSSSQLSENQQGVSLPYLFYSYAGIQGNTDRNHLLFFDLFLFAHSESLVQVKNSKTLPLATSTLQLVRQAMWCNSDTQPVNWALNSEIPDVAVEDHLVYRQRWVVNYNTPNGLDC